MALLTSEAIGHNIRQNFSIATRTVFAQIFETGDGRKGLARHTSNPFCF